MSDIKFEFIGWCKEDNHDKVWTAFWTEGTYYSAWGRRGAKLQFKALNRLSECSNMIAKKKKKYKEVDSFLLFSIFPDFEDKVSEELLIKTLQGKVK